MKKTTSLKLSEQIAKAAEEKKITLPESEYLWAYEWFKRGEYEIIATNDYCTTNPIIPSYSITEIRQIILKNAPAHLPSWDSHAEKITYSKRRDKEWGLIMGLTTDDMKAHEETLLYLVKQDLIRK